MKPIKQLIASLLLAQKRNLILSYAIYVDDPIRLDLADRRLVITFLPKTKLKTKYLLQTHIADNYKNVKSVCLTSNKELLVVMYESTVL